MDRAYLFLHLFFSFTFVGSLAVADWNSRSARAVSEWPVRAGLFGVVARSAMIGGLGSLLLLGVFGNLLSASLGYRMGADVWLRWVNGLWVAAVLVAGAVWVPGARRLAGAARDAAAGGSQVEYPRRLRAWRVANVALSALYLALLALMVFRWRT